VLLSRTLLTGLLAGVTAVWVSACLRTIDTPDQWPCASDSDCEDGKFCAYSGGERRCRSADYCTTDTDCTGSTACRNNACLAVQCTRAAQASCAPYVCGSNVCRNSCSSNSDCVESFGCNAGSCVPLRLASGANCSADQQCTSNHCCADAAVGSHQCESNCTLRGLDEPCEWDAICASGKCSEGKCSSCSTGNCVEAVCGNLTCGTVNGVDCGSCAGNQYCTDAGQCADACVDQECGADHGVACGTCQGLSYCAAGTCQAACVQQSCGTDHDVACGVCSGENYCDSTHACSAWTNCPAGSGVVVQPSATANRSCAACTGGYSAVANVPCTPWSPACIGVESLPPTATRDRACYGGWNDTYGSRTRDQESFALALIGGGDAVVGGDISKLDNAAVTDTDEYAYIRRLSKADGSVIWERLLGGKSLNRVRGLSTDSTGFAYAVGYAYGDVGAGNKGDADVFVIKLQVADGTVSWTRDLGTAAFDLGNAIAVAPDGNLLITGYTRGALAGPRVSTGNDSDVFAFKLSSADGSVLWQTQFGPGSGQGITVDANGDAFVAAEARLTGSAAEGDGSFAVRKLSGSTGGELWSQRFGIPVGGEAVAAIADASGDVFVSGSDASGGILTLKLAGNDGHRLWSQQLGPESELWQGIALTSKGNVLLTGTTNGDLDGEGVKSGAFVFELSKTDGSVTWVEQFGAPYRESGRAVAQDGSGSIWVTGRRTIDRNDPPTGATRDNSFVAKITR